MKRNKPIIGITIDSQKGSADGYSRYPWYATRTDSSNAVLKAGGIPVLLPYAIDEIENYCKMCHGIIISGGNFDIPPSMYGADFESNSIILNEGRAKFEFELLSQYFLTGKPILGICGGMQLLNVYKGGTLIQHIPDEVETEIKHEQDHPKFVPSHFIECAEGSKLLEITENTRYMVNSTHHQAVKRLGTDITASAFADDGIIEAIECKEHNFCVAVQWHPEAAATKEDVALFKSFVEAC